MYKKKNVVRNGFTMIELLVAISVISILTVIGLVNYQTSLRRTRDARRRTDLNQIRQALEIYKADNGEYPGEAWCDSSIGSCGTACPCSPAATSWNGTIESDLVSDYVFNLPVDPVNNDTHYYMYEPACSEDVTFCGRAYNCATPGTCCGYLLRMWLESDGSAVDVCGP